LSNELNDMRVIRDLVKIVAKQLETENIIERERK
jgi:hypothetical protein